MCLKGPFSVIIKLSICGVLFHTKEFIASKEVFTDRFSSNITDGCAGAQACVLVFSTTDRESFEAISSWREKVEMEVGDIPTVLVQNKIDLLDDTVIKK